jgi:histidine triad (HIT) family protein
MEQEQACLFCGIAEGRIPSRKVYEDDAVLAFHDINPKAPVHVLVIPKRHVTNLAHADEADWPGIVSALRVLTRLAEELQVADEGYRVVANNGSRAGQTVHHLHWHLMGGRDFSWPPG